MSLWESFKGLFQEEGVTPPSIPEKLDKSLGNLFCERIPNPEAPVCPGCEGILKKVPGRKTRCPSCKNYIYCRTHPQTKKLLTLTSGDVVKFEFIFKKEYLFPNAAASDMFTYWEQAESHLAKKFGMQPSELDIEWSLLNKARIIALKEFPCHEFAYVALEMARNAEDTGKAKVALLLHFEVCLTNYLYQMSLPELDDNDNLVEKTSIVPEDTFIPSVVEKIAQEMEAEGIDDATAEKLFYERCGPYVGGDDNAKGCWVALATMLRNIKRART